MTFTGETIASLGVNTAPFSCKTTGETNTISMFTPPSELAARKAIIAKANARLLKKIRKLQKKRKNLKKVGRKTKAKKLLKKVKI